MEHHPSGARSRRATHARANSRPRGAVVRALAALLVAGAAALSGLVAPERADADATLEPPGGGTVPVTSSTGRLGAATINGSGFDRTTNVPDNAYVGTVRGAGPFDAADPAQSSAPLQVGTAQPMLDAAVASGDYLPVVTASRTLIATTQGAVLATLGAAGAVLTTAEGSWLATPPPIVPRSTVGAGDASLAGYLIAYTAGASEPDRLRTAVAYGSAAAGLAGTQPPLPAQVDVDSVDVVELSGAAPIT